MALDIKVVMLSFPLGLLGGLLVSGKVRARAVLPTQVCGLTAECQPVSEMTCSA